MSRRNGPNIVTNGLTVYLDAANEQSYVSGSTTWRDISGNNNNATLYNSVTYTNNNIHTLNFDETNDYAKVDNTNVLSNTAYTKVAWFRPESSTANIISGGSDGQHAFWMASTSNALHSGHNGAWSTVSYSPGDMLNKWWFGAVTFNTTTGWALYLNGNLVNTSANTNTFTGGNVVRIGAYTDAANLFDGDIPIAMIYNRVLPLTEVQQIYNAQKARFRL